MKGGIFSFVDELVRAHRIRKKLWERFWNYKLSAGELIKRDNRVRNFLNR